MTAIIALFIATAIPLLFLYIVRKQDLYGTGAFIDIIASLVWGLIAYLIAALLRVVNAITIASFN